MLIRNPGGMLSKFIDALDRMLKPMKQLTFTS